MPRVSATALLGLFILLQASAASGQGFRSSNTPKLGVANPYIPVQHLYGPSQAWKPNYKNNPKSACSKLNPRSLCAAAINTASSEYAQLVMATSPRAYSTTNSSQSGYKNLVTPPGDQGFCQTCTAFAVTSAAETAMATALGVDAQDCSISVQALYFCPPPVKSCFAGWDLWNALNQLQQRGQELPVADCLPYTTDSNGEVMESVLCSGCSTTNKYARMGQFSSKQIMSVWEAQRHIRQYGSVISKFDVYTDFKAFFANKRNAKAIYKPGPSAKVEFGHAVALVGYDNDKQFWLAKNSWGPDWADNGFFRVAYDTCAVLTPETGEAWGVKWTPTPAYAPPARTLAVTRATGQINCFLYKAKPGDYLSRIAWLAGIGLAQFMLDNVDIVKDLDAPISGLNLKICNPMSDVPIEPGDCPGNDLKGIPDGCTANMSNVTACTQYCLSAPACKSFTFRPARTADGWCPGACWLKKGKTNQCNPDPKSNTGVVRRDVTLSVGFALENGDYKWNDLQDPDIGCKLNKASVQACAQYCQQNPACKSFTYHPAAGADGWCPNACWIKSGKTQKYNPDARYITGVRL